MVNMENELIEALRTDIEPSGETNARILEKLGSDAEEGRTMNIGINEQSTDGKSRKGLVVSLAALAAIAVLAVLIMKIVPILRPPVAEQPESEKTETLETETEALETDNAEIFDFGRISEYIHINIYYVTENEKERFVTLQVRNDSPYQILGCTLSCTYPRKVSDIPDGISSNPYAAMADELVTHLPFDLDPSEEALLYVKLPKIFDMEQIDDRYYQIRMTGYADTMKKENYFVISTYKDRESADTELYQEPERESEYAPTQGSEDNNAAEEVQEKADRIAEYTYISGAHTLNLKFGLEEGYYATAPYGEQPPEELNERMKDITTPAGNYEIYKDDNTLICSFYIIGDTISKSSPELPSFYDQTYARSKVQGNILNEGETDLYEYFFYTTENPDHPGQIDYCCKGRLKEAEEISFALNFAAASREEAAKHFNAMELWLTERSMRIDHISIDKTAKTIEADYYPEESATAHHIAVDFVSGDILSATNPDLFEANIVYEAQACEELLRCMNADQAVDTLEVKWK